MRNWVMLIFGYVMILLKTLFLMISIQRITKVFIDYHYGVTTNLKGWEHAERVADCLASNGPFFVMTLLCLLVLIILCRVWRKRTDEVVLSRASLVQLIFGLILCGSMTLGVLVTASSAVTEKVRDKWEIIQPGWDTKKDVMKKFKAEEFHMNRKVAFAHDMLNVFYFFVGFLVSLFVIRSTRRTKEVTKS